MNIYFSLSITDKIFQFKRIFNNLEEDIKSTIGSKEYGDNLSSIYVGLICVAPEYEKFYKPRRSKYYDNKEMSVDGTKFTLIHALEIEIALNYYDVLASNERELRYYLVNALIKKIEHTIMGHKKIKTFNLEELIHDIRSVL